MKCPRCNKDVMDNYRYCPHCGQSAVMAAQAAAAAPPPAPKSGRGRKKASETGRLAQETPLAPPGAVAENGNTPSENASTELEGLTPAAALAAAAEGGNEKETIRTLLSQANLYRLRGLWAGAIDRCVAVLRVQPDNQLAHSLLGDVYRDQGKIEEAIQWYRMAIELKPNASDEEKLKLLERERARQLRAAEGQKGRDAAKVKPNPAISETTGVATGTVPLLGVSPRRWMRGITITGLAFLALVLLALIVFQSGRHPEATASRGPIDTIPAIQQQPVQSLQPAPHQAPPASDGGDGHVASSVVLAGGGMPADRPGSTTTAPPSKEHASGKKNQKKGTDGLGLAPVTAVSPIQVDPSALSEEVTIFSAETDAGEINLQGGMRIVEVHVDPGRTLAAMVVLAPNSLSHEYKADPTATRAQLTRAIYRAAHAIFTSRGDVSKAKVIIQTEARDQNGNVNQLVTADVDRATALRSNADAESPARLQQNLLAVQWKDVGTP